MEQRKKDECRLRRADEFLINYVNMSTLASYKDKLVLSPA